MPTDDDLRGLLSDIRTELIRTRELQQQAAQRAHDDLHREMQTQRQLLRMLLDHATADLQRDVIATLEPVQMGFAETLETIARDGLSLTRFGDGEFQMMADPGYNLGYQRNSPDLRRDLMAAMDPRCGGGRVLVALPNLFRGNLHWLGIWMAVWQTIKPLIDPGARYGNAHVSRPVCFEALGAGAVTRWRALWQGRDVVIVTGRGSRFDLVPALFDNAARTDFVYSLPQHAHADSDRLLEQILGGAGPRTLVLLSLGPTATTLVPRIAAAGIQALDIGHISASYLNVHARGLTPEKLAMVRPPAP